MSESVRDADASVRDAEVEFHDVKLAHPLRISGGPVAEFTVAIVHVTVENRLGRSATGRGASILSIPWSWPRSALSNRRRDQLLRQLTIQLANAIIDRPSTDPLRLWCDLYALLDDQTETTCPAHNGEPIPHLAAMLALGAVDNAVHDGWARASARSAYAMYDHAHLNDDLAPLLGPAFAGRYPGEFLRPPRHALPIQHLVGPTDPLAGDEVPGQERSLVDWLRIERPRHIKIKLLGRDPAEDAARVVDVYERAHHDGDTPGWCTLAIDPNEGYPSPAAVVDLLDDIRARSRDAAEAISYIEQPIPRDTPVESDHMRAVAERTPVVMDEGLSRLEALRELPNSGWSGAAIKAAKGQTLALLVHSLARAHGLFLTLQDLTAVDMAFRHSARLASVLRFSTPHLEYNSRQYAPQANTDLEISHPALVTVADGHVTIDPPGDPGLY